MIQNKYFSKIRHLIAALSVLGVLIVPQVASALEIKDAAVDIKGDFVLEPAKLEVTLNPGEKTTKTLSIVNRTDREQTFTITVEDFEGSRDPNQVVVLLGNDKGPYSLRDFIKPEVKSLRLKPKQRAVMKVDIAIPADAEPGGHFASVLVSSEPVNVDSDSSESQARTVSRLGALYFVRVAGHIKEDASLKDFRISGPNKYFYEKGPFDFELLFENNSSVHLTPSGHVEIKNMIGRKVKDIVVPPFFSLPDSLRSAKVTWDSSFAFGRYTATAIVDRGYHENPDVTDTKTLVFWVLPWKIVLGLIVAILLVAFVLRRIMRSFEIKRKK
jgi:hypothetical protein